MNEYVAGYLFIGLSIGFYLFLFHYERPSPFAEDIYKALHGEKPWHYRIREKLVIPGAITLITLCWPIALYLIFIDFLKKKMKDIEKEPPYSFICRIEHILEECSIDAVEAQNIYVDPQNSVPKIPFGHLNKAWNDFIKNKSPQDKLYKFRTPKNILYGEYSEILDEDVKGYVLVRNEKIIAELITESYQ